MAERCTTWYQGRRRRRIRGKRGGEKERERETATKLLRRMPVREWSFWSTTREMGKSNTIASNIEPELQAGRGSVEPEARQTLPSAHRLIPDGHLGDASLDSRRTIDSPRRSSPLRCCKGAFEVGNRALHAAGSPWSVDGSSS